MLQDETRAVLVPGNYAACGGKSGDYGVHIWPCARVGVEHVLNERLEPIEAFVALGKIMRRQDKVASQVHRRM